MHSKGNWVEKNALEEITHIESSLEVPHGMKGVLVYLLTMNTLGMGKSCWQTVAVPLRPPS